MIIPRTAIVGLMLTLVLRAAEPTMRILTDVAYLGGDRTEKLDVYLPVSSSDAKPSPAVVWIHGGGWSGGTKNEARAKNICGTLADAGYVAVSIDYRLGDGAWPTNLYDCKNAVRFLRANAKKYGVDPARIGVAGGSAGGHLALMVALTGDKAGFEPPTDATPYPGVSSAVRCVANFYGITDLLTRQKVDAQGKSTGELIPMAAAKQFGADSAQADVLRLASPVTHVDRHSVPMLTLHGRIDATVDHHQAIELDEVARARGARHELVLVDGAGHTFDLQTWAKKPLSRDLRPVLLGFLEKNMK